MQQGLRSVHRRWHAQSSSQQHKRPHTAPPPTRIFGPHTPPCHLSSAFPAPVDYSSELAPKVIRNKLTKLQPFFSCIKLEYVPACRFQQPRWRDHALTCCHTSSTSFFPRATPVLSTTHWRSGDEPPLELSTTRLCNASLARSNSILWSVAAAVPAAADDVVAAVVVHVLEDVVADGHRPRHRVHPSIGRRRSVVVVV